MATGFIEKYMGELKSGNESAVEFFEPLDGSIKADPLERYRVCGKKNGLMEVVFTFADREGNLSVADENGVTITLLKDALVEDLDYYNAFVKDRFLANAFSVRITAIDEDTQTVYVRSSRSNGNSTKNRISREILARLKKGEMVHVAGRPRRIDPDCVYVDILCKGILGMCMVNNWQKGFTRYLQEECSTDYIYDFVITGQLSPIKGKPAAFALSRVPFTKDPWELVGDQFEENGVLVVKCIGKPEQKTYFWGKSPLINSIDIMCDYNDKLRISVGNSYKCKIRAVDKEKHIFKVAPFAYAEGCTEGDGVVRFLENQRKKPVRSRR